MNIKIGILNMPKHGNKYDLIHFITVSFIMRTWGGINCPSYKFTCEPNELYEDIADLLLQRRCLHSDYNKQTTNPNYFHDKSDLDTQINTSGRLQNKQIIFS